MKINKSKFILYCMVGTMLFWDVFDFLIPNSPFIVLGIVFIIYLIHYRRVNKLDKFGLLFLLIAGHGIFNIFLGNDSVLFFLKQYFSIAFCFVVYLSFVSNYKTQDIFRAYWNSAVFASIYCMIEVGLCILGITSIPFFFIFSKPMSGMRFIWLAGLFREPSFLGYFLAPAVSYIILKNICSEYCEENSNRYIKKWQEILIIIIMLLTFSTTAYMGIIISLIVGWMIKKFSLKKIIIVIILFTLIYVAYQYIPDIKERIKDVIQLFSQSNNTSISNLSSFTYYSNFIVTLKTFLKTRGIGGGLGSYPISYKSFNIGGWAGTDIMLNDEDANSMFLRITAELGVFGWILLIMFFIKYHPQKGKNDFLIGCSLIALFIMLLIRQGNYTHGGIILFVCLYMKIFSTKRNFNEIKRIAY